VREQLDALDADHAAEITAAMAEVRREGRRAAKHLRGDVWEVKAGYKGLAYRVLFAEEGDEGQVCLALELFNKKSQKTPPQTIALAERRAARLAQPRTPRRPLAISFSAYHC
jgi:phage-related protein